VERNLHEFEFTHATATSSIFRNFTSENEGYLTLCHSYLKPYCMGRKNVFFFSGHLKCIGQLERFRAFRLAWDI
jgi:hypothetical protein